MIWIVDPEEIWILDMVLKDSQFHLSKEGEHSVLFWSSHHSRNANSGYNCSEVRGFQENCARHSFVNMKCEVKKKILTGRDLDLEKPRRGM
jgi:hypothetical protein